MAAVGPDPDLWWVTPERCAELDEEWTRIEPIGHYGGLHLVMAFIFESIKMRAPRTPVAVDAIHGDETEPETGTTH